MEKNVETKRYYSIHDKVANEYCDMWSAKNNASALRSFNYSLATQKSKGIITDENDYELYLMCEVYTYDDGSCAIKNFCELVLDTEKNNEE